MGAKIEVAQSIFVNRAITEVNIRFFFTYNVLLEFGLIFSLLSKLYFILVSIVYQ